MSNLYTLANVKYAYQLNGLEVPILKGIDLALEKGCFSCFVGPSGTGKTTLLNLLGVVDQVTSGSLVLDGQNITDLTESGKEKLRLEKIGFIFQSFYLIPTLSVLENTTYFLPMLGYSKKEAQEIAIRTLETLGLKDQIYKRPSELSGGQRQRVAIARAIAKKPMVVLADEPTANLDSETAETIISAFKDLQASQGTSFIFSTHDPHLVSFATKVYQMKNGLIVPEEGN